MAEGQRSSVAHEINLNDSDETYYDPDPNQEPDEERRFVEATEDIDTYFERTYSKYGPGSSGGPVQHDTDETFFTPAENARSSAQVGQRIGAGLDHDTDETYFEPAENGHLTASVSRSGFGALHSTYSAPGTDETYFEPAENALWAAHGSRQDLSRRHARDLNRSAEQKVPDTARGASFFEGDEADYGLDEVLSAVGNQSAEGNLFSHDLSHELSQAWWGPQAEVPRSGYDHGQGLEGGADEGFEEPGHDSGWEQLGGHDQGWDRQGHIQTQDSGSRYQGHDVGSHDRGLVHGDHEQEESATRSYNDRNGEQASVQNDLYVQIPDPETQELRIYRVCNVPADSFNIFTQDLDWTQTQECEARGGTRAEAGPPPPEDHVLVPTGCWPQTHPAKDSSPEDMVISTSWAEVREGASSGDQSMGAPAAPPPPPCKNNSSAESGSDAQVVPSASGPSFEDDVSLPVPWPLRPEDQFRMEEIVASLSNMSFNLDVASGVGEGGDAHQAPSSRCGGDTLLELAESSHMSFSLDPVDVKVDGGDDNGVAGPSGRSPQRQAPRSPTFTITPHRRCRAQGGDAQRPSSPVLGHVRAASKRKRQGQAQGQTGTTSQGQQHRRTQSAGPAPQAPSPSSPPRRKARRTICGVPSQPSAPAVPDKARIEMIPVFRRLQELRFLMQDIIRGNESLPAPEDVAQMTQEVSAIISSIHTAASDKNLNSKAKLKREEAKQVAEKLLHQLKVLAEVQESSGAVQESSEGNFQATLTSFSETYQIETNEQSDSIKNVEEQLLSAPPSLEDASQKKETKAKSHEAGERKSSKRKKTKTFVKLDISAEILQESSTNIENCYNSVEDADEVQANNKENVKVNAIELKRAVEGSGHESENRYGIANTSETGSCNLREYPCPHDSIPDATPPPPNACTSSVSTQSCVPSSKNDCSGIDVDVPGPSLSLIPNENSEPIAPATWDSAVKSSQNENTDYTSTQSELLTKKKDEQAGPSIEAQSEYEHLVNLIKTNVRIRSENAEVKTVKDYVWRGGPLKLTGILLPKQSEFTRIDDLPQNFWNDPNAPIPEEWIEMIDWDD